MLLTAQLRNDREVQERRKERIKKNRFQTTERGELQAFNVHFTAVAARLFIVSQYDPSKQ